MSDIARVNECRASIKEVAESVLKLKQSGFSYGLDGYPTQEAAREAAANVMLAYRHLEDASMRLGKAIQALDGGVSVYDKKTTVGV